MEQGDGAGRVVLAVALHCDFWIFGQSPTRFHK
jgi:hypothetical protein